MSFLFLAWQWIVKNLTWKSVFFFLSIGAILWVYWLVQSQRHEIQTLKEVSNQQQVALEHIRQVNAQMAQAISQQNQAVLRYMQQADKLKARLDLAKTQVDHIGTQTQRKVQRILTVEKVPSQCPEAVSWAGSAAQSMVSQWKK